MTKASTGGEPSGLVFRGFAPDDTPQYAILSPTRGDDEVTWGDDEVTGIDEGILAGDRAFDSASMRRRYLSWAAYRRTTRPEDIACCLMGLFAVSMLMLYSSGLQEEMMEQSDDQSLFTWVEANASVDAYRGRDADCPPQLRLLQLRLRGGGCG
ncbi:hypothetical protein CDD83_8299 [Cordyceps sp. RAO-2017]|nr:hypothetical protein CDD83_8299 [Cordyceps sp. RAO-2017]